MWNNRTEQLIGRENLEKLQNSHVLIAGLGGVGSAAAEMLVRSSVGKLTIVDSDVFKESNLNRQLGALNSTIGKKKTEVLKNRYLDINPKLEIRVINEFLKDELIEELLETNYDYVIDAIDTLSPKVFLLYNAIQRNLKIVSSMGAGGKVDPLQIKIADISKTYNCNLAKYVRKRLYKLGIRKGIKVVFSPEEVAKDALIYVDEENKKTTTGVISYMPVIFGTHLASVALRGICNL